MVEIEQKKYKNIVKYPLFAWDLKLRKYHREIIWHTVAKTGGGIMFTLFLDDGYRKWRINIPFGLVFWEVKELTKRGFKPYFNKQQKSKGIYDFDAMFKKKK